MKKIIIASFFIGWVVSCQMRTSSEDTIINPIRMGNIQKNDTSNNFPKMDSIQKQAERKYKQIEIRYFDIFKEKHLDLIIWQDSILLFKQEKGEKKQEEINKNSELIDRLSKYIYFFFVEKNNYIVKNPREQGEMLETEKIMFDIIIHREIGKPIKERIIVEPDYIYSDEFMDLLYLLDSFPRQPAVYHLAPTTIQKTKRTYIQYFTEQKIKRTE